MKHVEGWKPEEDSWVCKWLDCYKCGTVTPHKPYLQNWGKASTECMECGDKNLFRDYRDQKCMMMELIEKENLAKLN